MGDNYLEAQAQNTKKRRAKAAAAINAPRLLVRPDHVLDQFTVDCHVGYELVPGDVLFCFPSAAGDAVDVVRGHERVGAVGTFGGAESLTAEMDGAGVGRLRVISFDRVSGSAEVEPIREDQASGHER